MLFFPFILPIPIPFRSRSRDTVTYYQAIPVTPMVQPMVVMQPPYGIPQGIMPYYATTMYPPAQYPQQMQQMQQPLMQQMQQPLMQQQPQPQPIPPLRITEDDIKQVKEMFPTMDYEVVKTVLESHRGNKDMAINALLQMSSEN